MQVAQISASAAVSVTDTKNTTFSLRIKLKSLSMCFQEKYNKSGKGCMIQNAFAAPIDAD